MRVLLRSTTKTPDAIGPVLPIDFHRRLPGYAETPLVEAPAIADTLGVGRVFIKDETARFGLPSFKILGASWAAYAALAECLGPMPDGPLSHAGLRDWVSPLRPLALIAATDGNHGRAVTRVARWLDLDARIYVPNFVSEARIRAIEGEGAEVVVIDGFYDASVDAALEASMRPGTLLISDTARAPTDDGPKQVTAGYTTAFAEVDRQLAAIGDECIDVVAVQAGVGGLASACTHWARCSRKDRPSRVAVIEPETAACVMTALAANEPVGVAADQLCEMNVLQCGTISLTAFDTLRAGVSCCLAVEDGWAKRAASALRSAGVDTGLSGAAGMAGLMAALEGPMAEALSSHLGLTLDARVLVVASEAAGAATMVETVDVQEAEPLIAALA